MTTEQTAMGGFGLELHEGGKRPKAMAWQGFTCPKCGGSMRTRSTGRANAGKYVVRAKECQDCNAKGITVEVWAPMLEGTTSVESFDEEQQFAKRERRRAKAGYHGLKSGHSRKPRTLNASVYRVNSGQYDCHPECKERE